MSELTTTEEKLNHLRTLGKVTLTSTAYGCTAVLTIAGENKSFMKIARKDSYAIDSAIQYLYEAVIKSQSKAIAIFK